MLGYGTESLLGITFSLIAIIVSWWALGAVKWEKFIHQHESRKMHVLVLFIAIFLGSGVALFLLNYIRWTLGLVYLF